MAVLLVLLLRKRITHTKYINIHLPSESITHTNTRSLVVVDGFREVVIREENVDLGGIQIVLLLLEPCRIEFI